MAGPVQNLVQHRAQQRCGQDKQRPGPRHLAGKYRDDDQGDDILNDQDADRRATVETAHLALGVQHLCRQHRRGEGQCDPDQQRQRPVRREKQPRQRREQRHRQPKVQQGDADDLRLADLAQLELEAHGEEQQQNTQFGEVIQDRAGFGRHPEARPQRVDGKARGQETHQRRQAQRPHREAEKKGGADGENLEDHVLPCPLQSAR